MKLIKSTLDVIIVVTLIACGTKSIEPKPKYEQNPELVKYLEISEDMLGGTKYPIDELKFVERIDGSSESVVGICRVFTVNGKVTKRAIHMETGYWNSVNDASKLALMIHEVIHCGLGVRGHGTSFGTLNHKFSPVIDGMEQLQDATDQTLEELDL